MELTVQRVLHDLSGLTGQELQRLDSPDKVELLTVTDTQIQVRCPTTQNPNPDADPWAVSTYLKQWVSLLSTGRPVHYEEIHKGSGTNRFGLETILANLPYIEWVRLAAGKGSRRHLVFVGEETHPAGQLQEMSKADKAKVEAGKVLFAPNFDFDFQRIKKSIQDAGLVYSDETLARYHLAMTSSRKKHFAVLAGISGTGKTQLAMAYANAVYHRPPLDKGNPYLLTLEVEARWQDDRPLLGYYNALGQRYERMPFLDFLLEADKFQSSGQPFFVCLDEMNIAWIEYYFARLLSAMESGRPFRIHQNQPGADKDGVPATLARYPENLYLTGTANTDETTHALSDKVLDRSFYLELIDVDFPTFVDSVKKGSGVTNSIAIDKIYTDLKPVQDALAKQKLHMGYRALGEIFAYLLGVLGDPAIEACLPYAKALDGVLAEKAFAKLRGDDRLKPVLVDLITVLKTKLPEDGRCLTRLSEMQSELGTLPVTQFRR